MKTLFLELATPDLYQRHPFRLLELPVEASTRDLSRRRQLVEQAARNDLQPPAGLSPVLTRITPPDGHEVRAAGHDLTDAKRRLLYELLWFWPLQSGGYASDEALQALTTERVSTATQTWTALAGDAGPSDEAAAAWHNMATYSLFSALEQGGGVEAVAPAEVRATWSKVWAWWLPLTEDGHAMWLRVRARIKDIDDPALKSGAAESLRRTLPTALALLQLRHAMSFWDAGQQQLARDLLSDIAAVALPLDAKGAVDDACREVADPLCESLQKQGEAAITEVRANSKKGADILEQFFAQALPLLDKIDLLLANTPAWVNAHDTTALAGLSCQINYGNETKEWSRSIPLLEKCLSIAQGQAAKDRIQANLKIIRGNAEGEALQKKCWFCGEQDAVAAHEMPTPMHGDVKTTYEGRQFRTTWKHVTVKVPRCKDCANAHSKANAGVAVGGLTLFLGAVLALIVGDNSTPEAGWGIAAVAFVLALIFGATAQREVPKIQGLNRPKNGYPSIKELRAEGWTDGEKPANT